MAEIDRRHIFAILVAAICCGSFEVGAESFDSGFYEVMTGNRPTEIPGLRDLGIGFGGWVTGGATYNGHDPSNHRNGAVTFNDRSAEFQLNQLNLFVERVVNKEAKHWDVGGRVDLMWGADSRFTQAVGHWDTNLIQAGNLRFYDIALPQVYAEVATPWVRGATVKVGHFYTILGYEVVQSPNNFFYSHSYAMRFGEPFTHTGALLNYPINDNFSFQVGAVTSPFGQVDNFDKHLSNWNFLGGGTWVNESASTSVSAAITCGPVNGRHGLDRTIASLVLNHAISDNVQYIVQFDHGSEQRVGLSDAYWYGLNQYLLYTLTESITLGLRGEWFRDDAGFRVTSSPASYFEVTGGVNWKPRSWLQLRLEGRNDWADAKARVFDAREQNYQFTLGVNGTVLF